ncbi:MAG: tRNA (adenosine(37)-N6)-threonylcarbamoyltransferase complex transferase subunit TsaD [candidate division KSB1 bacterium]|nr:tRNA (adenosine(37)-N6)-threonylcarbamoyltransferase complex transferase subunit TsaD [candidate division KSB1 bacterium]MDZ7301269.1 tRNA (adenosine(37)-N6)-threonylcarbamoyltransferase complex transferase subunit TsaD [candidate division KSB1 bacterium]MDZ7310508.1 tRNA (adenosine(37)-N6)-threonylcarbamoyltransferase complex transferase subunit TsaD [candidate division KSB1 bacterium]
MRLLAIETSCDETAAAVMGDGQLLANIIATQEIHQLFGGVVPELASRAHLQRIVPIVQKALSQARISQKELMAVAVTYGPGLIGSLLVGLSFAKGLALQLGVPLLGINHLEGHLFSTNIMPGGPMPPFLSLIISGGHTILTCVHEWGNYQILGQTQDDAAGEAFDKVAKILGLPYPGGPAVEKLAATGDPEAIDFPRARLKSTLRSEAQRFDFSFSGLKTAVLYHVRKLSPEALERQRADIAASFQQALINALVENVGLAHEHFPTGAVALAGGVACNRTLRQAFVRLADQRGFQLYFPEPLFCTDNAAMIARAAQFHLDRGHRSPLSLAPEPGLVLS